MEGSRFDALAKSLSAAGSRRRLLAGLLGAALAAPLGRADAQACKRNGKPCKQNSQCCSERCVGGSGQSTAHSDGICGDCRTSADCDLGLVCDASQYVCRSCASRDECAPLDELDNRFCEALSDGSGQARCANLFLCVCPGTCAGCGDGSLCLGTGGGVCAGKNLCCPATPAL
jgi:hypothetical protein